MALGLKNLPLQTAAVTGAILCVITGCLKEKEAYAGIDWVTIFLFAGMLPWLPPWTRPAQANSSLTPLSA